MGDGSNPEKTGQVAGEKLKANALVYAARGWPVFPCKPHSKEPLSQHGFHDATTDLAQIEEWWWRQPGANIGIPTGLVFDVVDYDDLNQALNSMPGTRVLTGRGIHWYVRATSYSCHRIRPGVDFKGIGGYVLVPPSWHPLGSRYTWQEQNGIVRAPDWVKPKEKRMWEYDRPEHPDKRGMRSLQTMYCKLGCMGEGNRNNYLFWATCTAAETGFPQNEVRTVLTEAALAAGLTPHEIERTMEQGFARWQS